MIANSVEKAELGSRIAGDTAASLAEIVSGIDKSNKLVLDIANSSKGHLENIENVSHGIEQVSRIAGQTSATAEESAAISADIKELATVLDGLVARFKLRD